MRLEKVKEAFFKEKYMVTEILSPTQKFSKILNKNISTPRKFKVNVFKKKLYSDLLKKTFFLNVSSKALKTIKIYGGLDNYLLKGPDKFLKDSQFGQYLKGLLQKKVSDPYFRIRYIPFTGRPSFRWKRRDRSDINGLPSIYIPPEAKRTDLSEMFYPVEHFETRIQKEARKEIERELESESDPVKRDELKKNLDLQRFNNRVRKDLLALMPVRHKYIRDGLMRIRDKTNIKLNFLKTLENSEQFTKFMLGEQYRHFSEDYPEVQLLLQETEIEKVRKTKAMSKLYKEYNYEIGEAPEDSKKITSMAGNFEPFEDKIGFYREKPAKKMNDKMKEKIKIRLTEKEKIMTHKKKEKESESSIRKLRALNQKKEQNK
jgi:ribosomal protein L28